MFKCDKCDDWTTQYKRSLIKHIKDQHLKCKICGAKFRTEDDKQEHEKTKHQPLHCKICKFKTQSEKKLNIHYEKKHIPTIRKQKTLPKKKIKNNAEISIKDPPPAPPPPLLPPRQQNRFKNIKFHQSYKPNNKEDLLKTQSNFRNQIKSELLNHLSKFGQLKFYIVFMISFYKYKDDELVYADQHFNAGTQTVLHEGDLDEKIDFSMQQIVRRVEEFLQLGSGWVYEETSKIDLSVFKYRPQRGGTHIPTPPPYDKKRSLINIRNYDDKCFIYCIQAARMYADGRETKHFDQPKKYKKYFHELDYNGLKMPMSLEDIRKFEARNNLAINVYGLNEKMEVIPLQITKVPNLKPINLLLLEKNGNYHYTWIKNLNGLLKHDSSTNYYCPFCMNAFRDEEKCNVHQEICREKDPVRVKFPRNDYLEFKHHKYMLKAPFTMYADFECMIEKVHIFSIIIIMIQFMHLEDNSL